jgi:hypothetical protein
MKLDTENFPLVWLREHEDEHDHNDEKEIAAFEALLHQSRPFAIIVEKPPQFLPKDRLDPEEKVKRAKLFKSHRADLSRLCVGFIVIMRETPLSLPVRKAVEGLTAAMGVPLNFAADAMTAEAIARERLQV